MNRANSPVSTRPVQTMGVAFMGKLRCREGWGGATAAPGRHQPCEGFQSADGMVLTIHGTPNLSIRLP